MSKTTHFLTVTFLFSLTVSNFCKEPSPPLPAIYGVYEATTPCEEPVLNMLRLSPDFKCEMMKWKLTLHIEPNTQSPSAFELICTYGMPKQGTRGFINGAKTLELQGKCTIGKGIAGNSKATVYDLIDKNSGISISFYQPDVNLLHLLSADKTLMVGTAAWSYTLNSTQPVITGHGRTLKQATQGKLTSDLKTVGIFEGRTPCNRLLNELHGISSPNCNVVKCQLTLFQDSVTHTPSTFQLYTIYVGFGDDNKYSCTGSWKILQGALADPTAIVYQLEPENPKRSSPILFQKGDENILFLMNNTTQLLSGNEYSGYTLNRKK